MMVVPHNPATRLAAARPPDPQGVIHAAAEKSARASEGVNAALATDFGGTVAGWFADRFNYNSNIYDTAIDSVYNHTRIGGASLHHLLDGNHSLWGALRAAHDASSHDSFVSEVKGAVEHLARDTCSKAGINPFFSMSRGTFDSVAGFMHHTFGVNPSWTADMLTFNAPELLGAGIGMIPLTLGWRKLGCERFGEMATGMTVAALVSANPVLLCVAGVAGVKAVSKLKTEGRASAGTFARGIARGALVTGTALAVSRFVPGPAWLGMLAGVGAAMAARHQFQKWFDTPRTGGA